MAKKTSDGGPAFPRAGYYPPTDGCDLDTLRERLPSVTEPEDGMSLRDYFAGQAVMGILANSDLPDLFAKGFAPHKAAEIAYMVADAMVTERDQQRKGK